MKIRIGLLLLSLLIAAPLDAQAPPTADPAEIHELLEEIARGIPAGAEPAPTGLDVYAESSAPQLAAVAEALAEYAETGEAPILGLPTERAFPYGHQVPVVRCIPLRACDIAFEAGERVSGWALGDTERWLTEQLVEGQGGSERLHLLLKPTDYDLATNLVVVTDRRTYHLELESPSHDEVHDDSIDGPLSAYDAKVTWWYPDDFVRRVRSRNAQTASETARAEARRGDAIDLDQPLDPEALSFEYALKRPWRRSHRLPWEPLTVFDDGNSVFIRLPAAARRTDLPVLLGLLDDGAHYPLNARLAGDWLVTPTLFKRAQLLLGTGERKQTLTIVAEER